VTRSTFRFLPYAALPAVLLVAACSSNNNSNSNTNTNSKPAPAASVAAGVSGASPAAGAVSQTFDEVTTDNKFSVTKMTTAANKPVTVNISNKGAAVHNWEVLGSDGKVMKDTSGKDIKGALLDAGKTESVTFTIDKAGTYKFQCEVHPADMTGTLTVQ
jgi:plastocyanin